MSKQNVILIFDIGKTNKKLLLFDEQYHVVHEESEVFEETVDEDGFPCEDLNVLTEWIKEKFTTLVHQKDYQIKAVNFSAYGASFVHFDKSNKPLTPLYNYLKPYPEKLKEQFYKTYGGESLIAKQTASPILSSLNSGLQMYRLKYEKPEVFHRIKYSLHLPQYLSFLISSNATADITSIGCHTHLWDFQKNNYHKWVLKERMDTKFPKIISCDKIVCNDATNNIAIGGGLHDSSSALIPYLKFFKEPFVLLSTGTWCISLNPFNTSVLTDYELHHDCLCYLSYDGKPVKASRLFAGYEHEQQVQRLADHFNKANDYYKTIQYNPSLKNLQRTQLSNNLNRDSAMVSESSFKNRALHDFESYEEAYHQLMLDLVTQQVKSTKIVLQNSPVKKLFVDGGFSQNVIYMKLLAAAFPHIEIFAASVPQASALGAALAIHDHWNKNLVSNKLISLKKYNPENL